jgi:hypothetical protein
MNLNKKVTLLAMMVVILIVTFIPMNSSASTPALHVEGNKIKDASGNTVILRGVSMIDVGAEDQWYGGVYKNIDRITNKNDSSGSSPGWYTKVIRIPVIPYDSGFQSPVPFRVGDDTLYTTLLRPVVDYCKQKDVYVILDWHYIDHTNSHVQTTSDFWRYMAPKFANDTNVLFELYNEPIDGGDAAAWNTTRQNMQNWYNIVRAAAPNNLILVGTPNWCQVLSPVINNPINGTNVVYVSHIYPSHWKYQWFRDELDALYKVYPIIMTEWGFSQSNEAPDSIAYGSIADYGQPLMDFIEARGISNTAWCANYEWGPPMFWNDWTLRIGPGEMGGFVKDQLYKMRNNSTPGGFGGGNNTPTPTRRAATATPTRRVTPTPTRRVVNTPTPTSRGTIGGYAVNYAIASDWGSGATINITITNSSTTAVNGWTLAWSFPGNQTITNLWNGTYTQSGASVSVKDAGYNANIPAGGGTVNFGFNLNYSGTNGKPTAFTLNGTACTVQ